MRIDTSELCDLYSDQVDVVEPIFQASVEHHHFSVKLPPLNVLKAMV